MTKGELIDEMKDCLSIAQGRLMSVEYLMQETPVSFDTELTVIRARKLVSAALEALS